MAKLEWDKNGQRLYEAGVDRGVLYPQSGSGFAWNGLVAINDSSSGGENKPYYIDGLKYYSEPTGSEYKATLEAFTYPDKFDEINGSAKDLSLSYQDQDREEFGLSYRTMVGNDTVGLEYGYKIHMVYNAIATPMESPYTTSGDPEDPANFTWGITARPERIPGRKPTSHLIWDTTKARKFKTDELESILYGTKSTAPRLPTPDELNRINHWGDALRILPRASTGLAELLYTGTIQDLRGDMERGLFKKHVNSRLVPASKPGFYKIGA